MSEKKMNLQICRSVGMDMDEEYILENGRVIVVGVGDGGKSTVMRTIEECSRNVEFIMINTYAVPMNSLKAKAKIQISRHGMKILGAETDPEAGRRAAEENREEIKKYIERANMVIITAGMGGSAGTGAAPVIAETAKSLGILTAAIVTMPFMQEGSLRAETAEKGVRLLSEKVDSIAVIKNDDILKYIDQNDIGKNKFRYVDDFLSKSIHGITDLINGRGLINCDIYDLRTVMLGANRMYVGIGRANGKNAAEESVNNALAQLSDVDANDIRGVILYIIGGKLSLLEVQNIGDSIHNKIRDDADIIVGSTIDESLNDEIQVRLIMVC